MKEHPQIALREFKATIFGVCFASVVALVGVAVGLKPSALSNLAAYHQQACVENPVLLGWTQHALPVMPTVLGLLVLLPLASAVRTLLRQHRGTSRLYVHMQRNSGPLPSKLARVASRLNLRDSIVCVRDPWVYAFCFGLISPRICVSTGMVGQLSPDELEAVLLHESNHLCNRDPLRLMLSRVAASAFVLLPVATELCERYQLAMELDADKKALARKPVEVLAGALLKVFSGSGNRPGYQYAAVGALDVTRERIVNLVREDKREHIPPLPRSSLFLSVFVALAMFLGTAGFSEAAGYWASRSHSCRLISKMESASGAAPIELKPIIPRCSHADERLEIRSVR